MSTKVTQFTSFQLALTLVATATLGGLVSNVAVSLADNQPSTSTVLSGGMVIPYEGYLMLDSTPMNVQGQEVQFELYDAPTGGTLQWGESQVVNIYNGKFSAPIGKGTKIASSPANATFDQVVLDAEKLFLSVKVKDVNGTFVELSGRQAIEAAPYAAWSANSSNLNVAGVATLQGGASLGNDLSVNRNAIQMTDGANRVHELTGVDAAFDSTGVELRPLVNPLPGEPIFRVLSSGGAERLRVEHEGKTSVANNFEVSGDISASNIYTSGALGANNANFLATTTDAIKLDYRAWDSYGTGDGGAAIYNDNNTYKALMVVGNNSGGGSRKVDLYDNVDINGSLDVASNITVSGNIIATSNIHNSCEWTSWRSKANTNAGTPPAANSAHINALFCPNGKYLTGMDFSHPAAQDFTFQEYYRLYCCSL